MAQICKYQLSHLHTFLSKHWNGVRAAAAIKRKLFTRLSLQFNADFKYEGTSRSSVMTAGELLPNECLQHDMTDTFEQKYRVHVSIMMDQGCLPRHDDEEVQPVPGVSQITAAPEDPKSHHLYHHLQCEEDVDECIKGLRGDNGRQRGRKVRKRCITFI